MKNKTFENVWIIFNDSNSYEYDGRDFAETPTRKIVYDKFSYYFLGSDFKSKFLFLLYVLA
jgi:hypothetical protein